MPEQDKIDQEKMDRLLHEMMAAAPPPRLSPAFDQRLKRRLHPRRLNSTGRWIMAAYALISLAVSIWAMRIQSIGWSLIAIAILAPLILAVAAQYRQRPRSARGHALQGH